MNFIEKKNVSFIPQADKIIVDPKSIRSILRDLSEISRGEGGGNRRRVTTF